MTSSCIRPPPTSAWRPPPAPPKPVELETEVEAPRIRARRETAPTNRTHSRTRLGLLLPRRVPSGRFLPSGPGGIVEIGHGTITPSPRGIADGRPSPSFTSRARDDSSPPRTGVPSREVDEVRYRRIDGASTRAEHAFASSDRRYTFATRALNAPAATAKAFRRSLSSQRGPAPAPPREALTGVRVMRSYAMSETSFSSSRSGVPSKPSRGSVHKASVARGGPGREDDALLVGRQPADFAAPDPLNGKSPSIPGRPWPGSASSSKRIPAHRAPRARHSGSRPSRR